MAGGLVGEVLRVWWQDAAELSRQLVAIPVPTRREWYRLGDGYLEIRSDDDPFRERLELLFRECVVPAPAEDHFPDEAPSMSGVSSNCLWSTRFATVSFKAE